MLIFIVGLTKFFWGGGECQYLHTLYSFCLNEKVSETTDWKKNYKYLYYDMVKKLTSVEIPISMNIEWCRIGRDNDGGYLMLNLDNTSKIAYSFGICDDTSWDRDMANLGYEVYQYDHTIEKLPEQNSHFHWKKIGITGNDETDNLKRLSTLLSENGHEMTRHMILKIDVEGAEWDVFANMTETELRQFDEIVVEWHDILDNDRKQVEKALKNVSVTHAPVHVHANNYAKVDFCGDILMPDVLEVTYLNRQISDTRIEEIALPHELDMPSCKRIPEIWLGNWTK